MLRVKKKIKKTEIFQEKKKEEATRKYRKHKMIQPSKITSVF